MYAVIKYHINVRGGHTCTVCLMVPVYLSLLPNTKAFLTLSFRRAPCKVWSYIHVPVTAFISLRHILFKIKKYVWLHMYGYTQNYSVDEKNLHVSNIPITIAHHSRLFSVLKSIIYPKYIP